MLSLPPLELKGSKSIRSQEKGETIPMFQAHDGTCLGSSLSGSRLWRYGMVRRTGHHRCAGLDEAAPPPLANHCMYASVPEKKKEASRTRGPNGTTPLGLAAHSPGPWSADRPSFLGDKPFILNEADDDNGILYRTQSRCNLSVNMKGPGGGPQVRFRNGPADLFREWRTEAKIN
ncbi:hypothetical protein CORC01_12052 [Colletotrichum orchidophilum]|uniref:Uncharacterized protein n=1 Tax=Colletotrichum orchidophilum TaxID=1209926 RepID=A0A1G4AU39_9PEZI|nr:uncharacterized protein CORC01_12052 [Colletotrichum orchidophilum]OHE92668.1 hypothetical protein CORC01_12052 [Colletotrichum orchidophilum]